MKITQIDPQFMRDWRDFIKILSVESTAAFLSELALPIQQQNFPQVMRLARACLEVYMGGLADKQEDPNFTWEFPKYWPPYRKNEPVLDDTSLRKYVERFKEINADKTIYAMYMELRGWIGNDTSDALVKWFENNYRTIRSGYKIWLHEFWRLLRIRKQNEFVTAPLNDEQWQFVQIFCDEFYSKQSQIRKRFLHLIDSEKSRQPSLWEAVLQTFPVDSYAGDDYPWLRKIQECFIFQSFRSEWRNLKNKLGPSLMDNFTRWVQQEANSYHNLEYITDDLFLSL